MKTFLENCWTRLNHFCSTQLHNFIAGMILTVIAIMALLELFNPLIAVNFSSIIAVLLFFTFSLFGKQLKKEFLYKKILNNSISAFLGSLWVIILIIILG